MNHLDYMTTSRRDRMLGTLGTEDEGLRVRLTGWVHRRRDLGGLVFVDLRDRSGILQISFGPDWTDEASLAVAKKLGSEYVLAVEGTVALRPEEARNQEMETGDVEVRVGSLEVLNQAVTPAIQVYYPEGEELPAEELRLRHRHLDLRRSELRERLILRHKLVLAARKHLDRLGFVEIETPVLTKRTPEGARDFLVPSRNHAGEFFALPQSPQIYKQILMTAGFDRYFQIARCFRDEDQRADRQPEFSQIDVEASFIEPEDLFGWMESLMDAMASEAGLAAESPFPRMSYRDAMELYGIDRPDLRWPEPRIRDWTEALSGLEFGIFRSAVEAGGRIRGLLLKGGAALSRREVESLEEAARSGGAPGLLWVKRGEDGASGTLARFMEDDDLDALGLAPGDLAVFAAGADEITSPSLAAVRIAAVELMHLPPERELAWLWVTDFPLFESVEQGNGLAPTHHPFSMPAPEDVERLESDPLHLGSLAYDLVLNGSELGSGSIRIHDPELQRRVLRVLGLDDAEIEKKFGFLLEALASGAPPHGGIALGVGRIAMLFSGGESLRDVVAFPKTTAARALFEGAPSPVSPDELSELHLRPGPGWKDGETGS